MESIYQLEENIYSSLLCEFGKDDIDLETVGKAIIKVCKTEGRAGKDFEYYNLERNADVGLIGKIYNYYPRRNLIYIETQAKITSTISFLRSLLVHSFSLKIPKDAIIHAHRPDHLAVFSLFRRNKCVLTLHGQQSKTVKAR